VLVFDTSAYINGRKHHLPIETFPGPWDFIGQCMEDRRIVSPLVVLTELESVDDEIYRWALERQEAFLEPSPAVQKAAGEIQAQLPPSKTRGLADPWVIAQAQLLGFAVVTYEGQTFAGVPTKNWSRSMPGMCKKLGVECVTLPQALASLGARFGSL
jgi:hypothetical protein